MKFGILTFHNTLNPGATLQAYALCRYLREQGIDCDIIDYRSPNIMRREQSFKPASNLLKTALLRTMIWPLHKKKMKGFLSFLPNEGMLSEQVYTPSNISEANGWYDAFIAGSDQIWNTEITDNDYNFFLDFVDDGHKFAYAASIGDLWSEENEKRVEDLLLKFDAISVREDSSRSILKERFGIENALVCDPTMLITPSQWEEIAQKPKEMGYVLTYMADDRTMSIATEYAKINNKPMVHLGNGGYHLIKSGVLSANAKQWIGYIINADTIFTDSYHGLLFSMFFNKKVWTCFSGKRSDRQKTLIGKIDAGYCRISELSDVDDNINVTERNKKIELFREQSQKWILDNLSGCLENE